MMLFSWVENITFAAFRHSKAQWCDSKTCYIFSQFSFIVSIFHFTFISISCCLLILLLHGFQRFFVIFSSWSTFSFILSCVLSFIFILKFWDRFILRCIPLIMINFFIRIFNINRSRRRAIRGRFDGFPTLFRAWKWTGITEFLSRTLYIRWFNIPGFQWMHLGFSWLFLLEIGRSALYQLDDRVGVGRSWSIQLLLVLLGHFLGWIVEVLRGVMAGMLLVRGIFLEYSLRKVRG